MEKFVMKNDNLVNVCREVKEFLNEAQRTIGYGEVAVMYSVKDEKFFSAYTCDINRLEFEGNVEYKIVNIYQNDKRKTIKSLKWEIFKK